MTVSEIGSVHLNQASQSIESSSESSLLIIQNTPEEDEKKNELMLFAYHVDISHQGYSMQSGEAPGADTAGSGFSSYGASGQMVGSIGAMGGGMAGGDTGGGSGTAA